MLGEEGLSSAQTTEQAGSWNKIRLLSSAKSTKPPICLI